MELPKRKPMRLPEYDYAGHGAYFVTICTKDRRCILSNITVGADAPGGPNVQLTDTGKTVEQYIQSMERMAGFHVDKYVVMPNHIHMILSVDNGPPRASAPTVSDAVGALKRLVNRRLGRDIWQRSFHEHVIRNEQDYREIWEYIDENPARWVGDRYYEP
ncbi:MAG: hypothetical protein E7427_07625 [Ruminococcaceae bacterium]|nr:hypothetical protein [Oscillospiraceae bacterium]